MISCNMYLRALIRLIESKRELSIRELSRTDINDADIIDVEKWYNELISYVKGEPPSGYVYSILVEETDVIIKVTYRYTSSEPSTLSVAIKKYDI